MIRFLSTVLLAMFAASFATWPSMATGPKVDGPSSPKSAYDVEITFVIGDTADSRAIPVSGFCSVRYEQASGDDASLYAVTTASTAATSGTLIAAFTSSTTTATTFTAGTRWVKAVATDATAGGSVMQIDCAPLTGGGGGGDTFSVLAYGAQADGTTNDVAAINRAVDAACDAGGGIVFFPEGTYGVGSTGANQFYSGIQVTCSNVILLGVPFASKVVPLFTHGGSLLNICPEFDNDPLYGDNENCDDVANISGVRVEGLYFHDADARDTCDTYSAAAGTCAGEESHAIYVDECDGCVVTGNKLNGLGDEGIVFYSNNGGGGTVSNNIISNTPAIRGSSGSAIDVAGQNINVIGNVIEDILADPFTEVGTCTTQCDNSGTAITAATNTGIETTDMLIANNTMRGIGAYAGIFLYANADLIADITVSGNMIEMTETSATGCVDTPSYPGTSSRCAIKVQGSSGTPTFDRISLLGNTVTGGIGIVDVDNVGSISIDGNTITGDTGVGIRGVGAPLTITGNTISQFDAQGIYVFGLQDDDRTESVNITGNNLFGNNKDDTQDGAIEFYAPATPCGTDTVVPGGVNVSGNTIIGSATASSLTRGIGADSCARMVANNNVIDFLSAGYGTGNNGGIFGAAVAIGNRIKNPGVYGIISFADYVVYSGNRIENPAAAGIHVSDALATAGSNGLMPSITGNTVITAATPAIDANGEMPICLGNTSVSTTAADRTIVCGEGGVGVGCTADTAAGGICDDNQVCNTGDSGC